MTTSRAGLPGSEVDVRPRDVDGREDRMRRAHRGVSLVRRGAETYESATVTFVGPYTLRCVVCDQPSEKAACCA